MGRRLFPLTPYPLYDKGTWLCLNFGNRGNGFPRLVHLTPLSAYGEGEPCGRAAALPHSLFTEGEAADKGVRLYLNRGHSRLIFSCFLNLTPEPPLRKRRGGTRG